jgi:hypothetical protein
MLGMPYRWSAGPEYWWRNIGHGWDWWVGGLKNLWHYRRVVWHQRWFDYDGVLWLMEHTFRRMARRHREWGITADADKTARELDVCAVLCRRIRNEEYEYGPVPIDFTDGKITPLEPCAAMRWMYAAPFRHPHHRMQADLDYLTHLMRRKMLGWWD